MRICEPIYALFRLCFASGVVRFYGETRRSVDDGLLLNLCEEDRKSITASVVSTVFMLNSAVGTLVNGILSCD